MIAIENVRLFTELEARNRELGESLERQTATARHPPGHQPLANRRAAGVRHHRRERDAAVRGPICVLFRFEGELIQHVAPPASPARLWRRCNEYSRRALRGATAPGRTILDGAVIHSSDVELDRRAGLRPWPARAAGERPRRADAPGRHAHRRDPSPRAEARPFSDKQIALLKTFADQAVIAIENVRLFTELQASNRELTTALDTQTATSDILRVISRSQTDVQPVFDAIVVSAVRLLGAYSGTLTRLAGDQIELAALTSTDDAGDAALRAPSHSRSIPTGRTPRPFAIERRSISPTPTPIPDCPKPRAPSLVSVATEARWWCRCSVTTRRSGRSG